MTCRICGGDIACISSQHLNMRCPDNYPLDGSLKIGICQNCGFVANIGSSVKEDYDNYYLSINKHHIRSVSDQEFDLKYFNEICNFIEEKCNFKFSDSKVCDFGSSASVFSDIVRSRGGDCKTFDVGADPSTYRNNDLVISTHTFEHIYDLHESMITLRDMVREGGLIVVAVPDFKTYSDNYYGPYNHFDLEHINHFDEHSLRHLMQLSKLDFISSRQSRREARLGLYYSEILIIAQKRTSQAAEPIVNSNFSANMATLGQLLEQSYQDWNGLTQRLDEAFAKQDNCSFVLYGLSSFAFRVLNYLEETGKKIDQFADSDERLGRYRFGEKAILSKQQFLEFANAQMSSGKEIVVIVAAVGSRGIVKMLQEFDLPNLSILNLYDYYGADA